MLDITCIILTKNEEKNIGRAIKSVKGFVKRVVVVDCGSTDRTVEISRKEGADVYFNPWTDHATQFNWALDNVNIDTKWVMRLDADEQIGRELRDEIQTRFDSNINDIYGFEYRVRVFFMGRWVKHGGAHSFFIPRIFRFGYGRVESRRMDERIIVSGKIVRLKNDLIHYDYKGLNIWSNKHVKYAELECQDYFELYKDCSFINIIRSRLLKPKKDDQNSKRNLKREVYYSLPKYWRARFFYIYTYYFQLGFLDGTPGKIFFYLHSFWYRYLVDSMIEERERLASLNSSHNVEI